MYVYTTSSKQGLLSPTNSSQYFVEDCILDNIRSSYQMNYQSAAVILGILPGLLGSLGARLSEISYLSVHRPVLSLLLAVGSPAVWPTRVFEYDDPVDTVKEGLNKLVIPNLSDRPRASACLSALQYVLALASIANMIEISLQLGRKTVLAWSCLFDYGPLLWVLLPVVIHLLAAVTYNIEIRNQRMKFKEQCEDSDLDLRLGRKLSRSKTLRKAITAPLNHSWWTAETRICANREKGLAVLLTERRTSKTAVFMNCAANILAFGKFCLFLNRPDARLNGALGAVHLVFGTLLFASLVVSQACAFLETTSDPFPSSSPCGTL